MVNVLNIKICEYCDGQVVGGSCSSCGSLPRKPFPTKAGLTVPKTLDNQIQTLLSQEEVKFEREAAKKDGEAVVSLAARAKTVRALAGTAYKRIPFDVKFSMVMDVTGMLSALVYSDDKIPEKKMILSKLVALGKKAEALESVISMTEAYRDGTEA